MQAPEEGSAFGHHVVGASVLCHQDARAFSATPAGAEDQVLPWQPLAGTPTSARGCQLAGAEGEAQQCSSQNQLSSAKERFRLTCEGSSLGAAFA